MATGLLVAGVGRSGTSIAAQLTVAAGMRPPPDDDLMPGNFANPGGYWESLALAALNDELLAELSATWWRPPAALPRATAARMVHRFDEGRDRFTAVYGTEPGWVWKDPRLTVLLPFWAEVLTDVAILVTVREPVAIARSIARRDGLPLDQCLAIAERHLRLLVRALEGHPVLIARHEHLVADPAGWTRNLLGFAAAHGLPAGRPTVDVTSLVGADIEAPPAGPAVALPDEHAALQAIVVAHLGRHDRFPAVALPPPSPAGAALIDAIELPEWSRPAEQS